MVRPIDINGGLRRWKETKVTYAPSSSNVRNFVDVLCLFKTNIIHHGIIAILVNFISFHVRCFHKF